MAEIAQFFWPLLLLIPCFIPRHSMAELTNAFFEGLACLQTLLGEQTVFSTFLRIVEEVIISSILCLVLRVTEIIREMAQKACNPQLTHCPC